MKSYNASKNQSLRSSQYSVASELNLSSLNDKSRFQDFGSRGRTTPYT